MGYFQHKYGSIEEAEIIKKCQHCGDEFQMTSGNQKYCSRSENPECDDDRYFKKLWDKGKHPLQSDTACL